MDPMLMTEPPPRALMCAIDSCSRMNGARRFTAMIVSQRATAVCSRVPRPVSAALLTRISRPPNRSTAKRINWRQTSSLVRSPSKYSAVAPAAVTRRTVSTPSARSRPCTTMFDPSRAKRSAMPRPIPEVDPVTTDTLPSSVVVVSGRLEPLVISAVRRLIEDLADPRGQRLAGERLGQKADAFLRAEPSDRVVGVAGHVEHAEAGRDDLESRRQLRTRQPGHHD